MYQKLDGLILSFVRPHHKYHGNTRPPKDFSKGAGLTIALAQQFFNITTTEVVCQPFGISIRPHARVAIVAADVTKEYLDVVEDGMCTEGMELRVSRGFDLK